MLDVGLHLLHQPIELIWGSERLFLFVLPRIEGGILDNNLLLFLLLLLLVLGAGPALVLAFLPLVDIVIELLIVVVLFTVVTSSFTLHLFNYVKMI